MLIPPGTIYSQVDFMEVRRGAVTKVVLEMRVAYSNETYECQDAAAGAVARDESKGKFKVQTRFKRFKLKLNRSPKSRVSEFEWTWDNSYATGAPVTI